MKVLLYILRAAWGEASWMARLIYIVAVVLPGALPLVAGATGFDFDGLPWWGWFMVAVFISILGVTYSIGRRAYRLDEERKPRIGLVDLAIYDDGGEQYIRVSVTNLSSLKLEGLMAYITHIDHKYLLTDSTGNPLKGGSLDYPIQLFTQQRLREKIDGGPKYARPFDLAVGQPKWLEIFQTTSELESRVMHIHDAGTTHHFKEPRVCMVLNCCIYGPGPETVFEVYYETTQSKGYHIVLRDGSRRKVQEKQYDE